jgi:putative hydrolase of the HAD superfamily
MPRPVILFDAGNTLIVEQPDTRPMVEWVTIEAVPGVESALRALCSEHILIVASNADVSTGEMARQALARLSLDSYFDFVYTSVDLKLSKPDRRFFLAILEQSGAALPATMIGDTFFADIAGAKNAGLKAVWYNPAGKEAPGGMPVQDAEFSSMLDLPGLFEKSCLPDIRVCEAWLAAEGAGERLLAHVREVARAAYHLACLIRQTGEPIDPLLVQRGAMLHDLDKLTHRSHGLRHGEYAGRLLEERGWPELAAIARRHLIQAIDPALLPVTLEEKVVNYADKLVEGDRLIGLLPRIQALMERYPAFASEMEASLPFMHELENELCRLAGKTPQALYAELQARSQANP